jgi:hypothetical protein
MYNPVPGSKEMNTLKWEAVRFIVYGVVMIGILMYMDVLKV